MTVAGLPFVTRRSAVSSGGSPGCAASAAPVPNPQMISNPASTRIALARVFRTEELLRFGMSDRRFERVEAAGLVQLAGHRADRVHHHQGDCGRRAGATDAERLQFRDTREAGAHPAVVD